MIYIRRPSRVELYDNRADRLRAGQVRARLGCGLVINGGYFGGGLKPYGNIRIDGKWLHQEPWDVEGFIWDAGELPVMGLTRFSGKGNVYSCMPVIVGGAPQPVKDNDPELGGRRGRSGWGVTAEGRFVFLCTSDGSGPMLLSEARDKLLSLGCVSAVLNDGGASSQMSCPGGEIAGGRIVSNYICVWFEEDEALDKKYKICLDPGHGLKESYNGSPDGSYKEHEFALDMGFRVKAHLERCGFEVMLTREDGATPTLTERANRANGWGTGLFVSLHSNAIGEYGDSDGDGYNDGVRGLTAWISGWGGERERFARRLIDQMKAAGVGVFGLEVYLGNFTVLKKTGMAACLIEYAFHTAREDVELLKSDAHRGKLAEATARAVCLWAGAEYIEDKPPKGAVYRVQVGAFMQKANAERMKAELETKGYAPYIVEGEK